MQRTRTVSGFVGENRELPDIALPPNVSPDALNIDYRDGTLKKRSGVKRLHSSHAENFGGLRYDSVIGASTFLNLLTEGIGTNFYVRLFVKPSELSASTDDVVVVYFSEFPLSTVHSFALQIVESGGNHNFRAYYDDNNGYTQSVSDSTLLAAGTVYDVKISYRSSAAVIEITVDSVLSSQSISIPSAPLYFYGMKIGGSNSDNTGIIDNLMVGNTEYHYYTFDNPSGTTVEDESIVGALVDGTIPNDSFWANSAFSSNTFSTPLMLAPLYPGAGNTGIATGTTIDDLLVGTYTDLYSYNLEAKTLTYLRSGAFPWSWTVYNGKTIFCNKTLGNFRYDVDNPTTPTYHVTALTPPTVDISGITIAENGGGVLTAGDYIYEFRYVDKKTIGGTDVVLSLSGHSTETSPVTVGASKKTLISNIPECDDEGVTHIQILRTKAGGGQLYHVAYITNGTTTYDDNTIDSLLVTPEDEYVGSVDPSAVCGTFNDMVWLANQDGNESRVVFSEKGSYYKFYPYNEVYCGRGDGDEITGGIAIGGQLLITKKNSLWAITGNGPQSLNVYKVYDGEGCVNGNTIKASSGFVYYMSASGVMRIPLPFGSGAPQNITTASNRSLFDGMSDSEYAYATAAFFHPTGQYFISFQENNEWRTLVWTEDTQSWALHDTEVGSYLSIPSDSGRWRLLAGWRGYVCELLTNDNDGVDVDGATTNAVSGTVTSAASTTLTDSAASFATDGDGLAGVSVRVGTETKTILSNTATELTIDSAWSTTPSSGDTYYLGPIDAYWESPNFTPFADLCDESIVDRLWVWFDPQISTTNVNSTITTDDDIEDDISPVLDASVRQNHRTSTSRGYEVKVRFENNNPDEPFEIEGFKLMGRGTNER